MLPYVMHRLLIDKYTADLTEDNTLGCNNSIQKAQNKHCYKPNAIIYHTDLPTKIAEL